MFVGKDIGPFAVEKELGSGAMGTVYLARYEEKGRHVALKFMSPNMSSNSNAAERFEREFDILKQLRHPNIVRLIATGKYQKLRFYAMEFIEGESLDRVLVRRGRLPWQEVVALGKQLCSALQHAHQQGIIHRDLKPSNLMIAKDGTLKLTDFGIAKDLDVTQLTATNSTVGTAAYMSPEQCRGERNLSHKCDLYSLGIVFYELLTGAKPYTAENAMDMFLCHVKGKFERPSRREMDIPVWLDTIVCHLLEKDPKKRPYDAAKVAEALDQVAEKVAAQRSAGVDAVTGTTEYARSRSAGVDKGTARTLMQGLGKVKKKKGKPLYARAWFRALGVAALLLGVGALIVVALLPPSAESLFEEAKKVMESKDADKIDRARDNPTGALKKYLAHYGKRDDKPTEQVWEWVDQIDADRRERALVNRLRANLAADDPGERKAQAALRQEEAGESVDAAQTWQALKAMKGDVPSEQRAYNRIADKHLRDLAAVDERFQSLQNKLEVARGGQEAKPDSESEETALLALRYQQFGDLSLAQRRWSLVRFKNEKDPENRVWFLLAARQVHDLKGKQPPAAEEEEARAKLVKDKLAEARRLAMTGRPDLGLILAREILALYVEQRELKDLVTEARNLAAQLSPAPR